ncbi:efflux RND transporter permease subunit [Sulfitobacter donghicola]|uniref:Acriflavine resistance protein B n=1 Tax=Sulfitobacter donghicola DSW-25 = KCTC 12864 = JCM 14565 TaxID=1300350 RepID=A0A073IKL0_9RHOB|nr:efflux RND transporter permease subunit [Sulfitobacter donghicola]KEJ90095.1 acriflavine resistance protein B [Sulfitobacter donghicola DSW-25 = KCTC 12864 = JCM 14565]KIN66753.1 RND transporter, HAE1/HME family, permease protein [Sulfitobacter donghicola DSW-25 = KCTC 12864 = JCM 14565]
MTGIVDWAASRARMVVAFILLSLIVGAFAYTTLPKEGEPDIEIPALFVSVPFPGISAADAETLLLKPMETELSDLDGLKTMTGTAAENYAGLALEFEFGWDKTSIIADVRDSMGTAEALFPDGAETYSINEINFSEFPIIIVNMTGPVPERTMARYAKQLQDDIEGMDAVLEAGIAGNRDEMLEVLIDPLKLEAYDVTANELIQTVQNNNQLIAAGEVESESGTFSVKIPSSFDEPQDVYDLPVKTNGNRVVTLGDLAQIHLTFEDRLGTSRFDGESSVALQVVKRKGFNLIQTASAVKELVAERSKQWPEELRTAVEVGTSNDQSRVVDSMVQQLLGSVFTAIALVMIVVLAALGIRAALLVGFAIPTSFLLCFAFLALMGISISNIVMFGLILAVGMLVDSAIVVVEYADQQQQKGSGPMQAYVEAAKRMFWPVISSTATTLCAFLPMLFWPGVPGQFMGMLPVTLIFVLSASLIVALVYLPVMGGVTGRLEQWMAANMERIAALPWYLHLLLFPAAFVMIFPAMSLLAPSGPGVPAPLFSWIGAQFGGMDGLDLLKSVIPTFIKVFGLVVIGIVVLLIALAGFLMFLLTLFAVLTRMGKWGRWLASRLFRKQPDRIYAGYKRSPFGRVIEAITGNPVMPLVMCGIVFVFVGTTLIFFSNNSKGVEFFVESEPEQAIVYVLARGNLSLNEKDDLLRQAEQVVLDHPGIATAFAFAGEGGLDSNTGGSQAPKDLVGQIQIETIPWEDRALQPELDGDIVIAELTEDLSNIPGIKIEVLSLDRGPASGKPVHLRFKSDSFTDLVTSTTMARAEFDTVPGLTLIEDTRPLPGIDWQIDVDVEKAGQYGADVLSVGAMVQLVTRGLLLDTMRVDSSDEEIEIRVRFPEEDRLLSTLDTLKVRTLDGLIPLSNFITRTPVPKLAEISRIDQKRYMDVKADVTPGLMKIVSVNTGSDDAPEVTMGTLRPAGEDADFTATDGTKYKLADRTSAAQDTDLQADYDAQKLRLVPVNANERIAEITKWIEGADLPDGVTYEWTGDQEDQAESGAFLQSAFTAALGLMFIILLAQFNSFYNAVLVLLAVVLSTAGVLIGMLVMEQTFSIIMTGTGIVALAGIVVNNNIILIDTYQEFSQYMPRIEAIIRTAQARIRPVLLTTITTMAGLAPMMFGLSLDFAEGGYTIDSPTALWWKQLATAVVFGLGIATVLTLVLTPSLLAVRVWATTYAEWIARLLARMSMGRASRAAQDWALHRNARRSGTEELIWSDDSWGDPDGPKPAPAAE